MLNRFTVLMLLSIKCGLSCSETQLVATGATVMSTSISSTESDGIATFMEGTTAEDLLAAVMADDSTQEEKEAAEKRAKKDQEEREERKRLAAFKDFTHDDLNALRQHMQASNDSVSEMVQELQTNYDRELAILRAEISGLLAKNEHATETVYNVDEQDKIDGLERQVENLQSQVARLNLQLRESEAVVASLEASMSASTESQQQVARKTQVSEDDVLSPVSPTKSAVFSFDSQGLQELRAQRQGLLDAFAAMKTQHDSELAQAARKEKELIQAKRAEELRAQEALSRKTLAEEEQEAVLTENQREIVKARQAAQTAQADAHTAVTFLKALLSNGQAGVDFSVIVNAVDGVSRDIRESVLRLLGKNDMTKSLDDDGTEVYETAE